MPAVQVPHESHLLGAPTVQNALPVVRIGSGSDWGFDSRSAEGALASHGPNPVWHRKQQQACPDTAIQSLLSMR